MLGYEMIYYRMTGYDNLKYFAKIYGVKGFEKRIKELSHFLELDDFLYDFVENYSIGMKSKLALARSLINDPKILFLDEPTLGLDVNISDKIRDYIKSLTRTVIITTHYLEEAKELCGRIALMNKGRIEKIFQKDEFSNLEEKFAEIGRELK
jgi:ABC-2 type transport system ATP-binding protein